MLGALLLSSILTLALHSTTQDQYQDLRQEVLHVHVCEADPWNDPGPEYKGGLGWLNATWLDFKLPWMPSTMNLATIREQVIAMIRFSKVYGMPDLGGCHGY